MSTSFSHSIVGFFKSTYMTSLLRALFIGGIYVTYKDNTRWSNLVQSFHNGCVLKPFKENSYEVKFVARRKLESKLKEIMSVNFTKQFYVVSGQIGTGKSRLVLETARKLINEHLAFESVANKEHLAGQGDDNSATDSKLKCGAPIYVSVDQGANFADTLAEAVNFRFDEHIRLQAFIDSAFGISTISSLESKQSRLARVLNAIEISAYKFIKKYKSPVVIVVDQIEKLQESDISLLFMKAKFWADENLVKFIFVTNSRKINELLHLLPSYLARANFSLVFGDLNKQETLEFLQNPSFMELEKTSQHINPGIPLEIAVQIHDLVGGRMSHLVRVKKLWTEGYCLQDIEQIFKNRELEKFRHISREKKVWSAISLLRQAPKNRILYSKLIKQTSLECLDTLEQHGIVVLKYRPEGVVVAFESRLTKVLMDEQHKAWEAQKLLMNKEQFVGYLAELKKRKEVKHIND